ncbi:MAG TPA: YsnF/AvaK domain-containing protein [Candidatus Limnocylindrales bacterium]
MPTIDQVQPGWAVYGSDGKKIGSVQERADGYVAVSKGTLLPTTYYVPSDGIQDVRPDESIVIVACAKDEFEQMGWDQPPTGLGDTRPVAGGTTREATTVGSGDAQRIARYEEDLRAEKSRQQTGEVRVGKDVTEEERSMDVPVTREDVQVRRVAVDRPATGKEGAFSEGDTVRVPVTAEQVNVSKEPRVVEELEIRKTPRQETQRVSETVRKERFDVDRSGDVEVDDRAGDLVGAGADRTESQRGWDAERPRGHGIHDKGGDTEIGGGAAGAVGGAAVGGALGGPPGAVVGGIAGAAGGAAAGDAVDEDEDEGKGKGTERPSNW